MSRESTLHGVHALSHVAHHTCVRLQMRDGLSLKSSDSDVSEGSLDVRSASRIR